MPFVKIWIHLIFSTKNRKRLITKEIKNQLINHILENAKEKEIFIDFINGVEDHLHILLSLGIEQNLSKVVQLIKGESSHWINQNKLLSEKFSWQDEYIAISVSPSIIQKVREYIKNQESHHKKLSFSEEYDLLMKKFDELK